MATKQCVLKTLIAKFPMNGHQLLTAVGGQMKTVYKTKIRHEKDSASLSID
ncbi:hypothetical protein HAPAU_26760 [Halalkalicoccus paucihalophilus]|uniref:Uncharacterized protein n=1 Tax=Halalkalicoccus paucihalophilus TaxID=1008153 RepID=A0A151ABW8_9EURY|nr:hypothetical protein HAPAU_26760 [Halalkalicoccus paucihalophilus]